jgi:hypothetical protein
MPLFRLRPSYAIGSCEDAVVIARSPRAAVVAWYGNDGENKVARFPRTRGFRVTPGIDPIDEAGPFYVRAARVRATEENRRYVENRD